MTLPLENIIELIPQKSPFVMVSKLLYTDEAITRSSFHIGADIPLVVGNLFQEAGLIENMAQTAALRAGYKAKMENVPVAVGYIGSVREFEVYSLPRVNDELITEISMENQVGDITVFSGRVWHKDNLLAKCVMTVVTSNV